MCAAAKGRVSGSVDDMGVSMELASVEDWEPDRLADTTAALGSWALGGVAAGGFVAGGAGVGGVDRYDEFWSRDEAGLFEGGIVDKCLLDKTRSRPDAKKHHPNMLPLAPLAKAVCLMIDLSPALLGPRLCWRIYNFFLGLGRIEGRK